MALAALGIVFGDIGTSPLYGFRVALDAAGGSGKLEVFGILSLIFWSLIIVVTLKYVLVILRADNGGEGGILALAALLDLHRQIAGGGKSVLVFIAMAGAALLFGDAVITPAISVLSAVEGLHEVSAIFTSLSVPIACIILFLLFVSQRFGILKIAVLFGPIMLIWFLTLAISGGLAIWRHPEILTAILPNHAFNLMMAKPGLFVGIVGGVFLTVTGGEALYADLGQFGRTAITKAWLVIALPGLVLNYFGQGALLVTERNESLNSFYGLFSQSLLLPAIGLATLATIIASQAVITGLFSLGRQAIQLGFMPPMRVLHMTQNNEHDVYIPVINLLVAVLSISVVIGFGSSDSLADAYGISVAGAMVTTTVLYVAFAIRKAKSSRKGLLFLVPLLSVITIVDIVFLSASLGKLLSGGLVPLLLATMVLIITVSWRKGRERMGKLHVERAAELGSIAHYSVPEISKHKQAAIFLIRPGYQDSVALNELTKLAGSKFSDLVIMSVWIASKPKVSAKDCVTMTRLSPHLAKIDVKVGYMQRINVPSLIGPTLDALAIDSKAVTYVVSLERPIAPSVIRNGNDLLYAIYAVLARLAVRSTDRFKLPETRILEVGVPRKL